MDRIVIASRKPALKFQIISLLVMTAFSLWLLTKIPQGVQFFRTLVMIMAFILAYLLYSKISLLTSGEPLLVIAAEGIWDNTCYYSFGDISWTEIEAVTLKHGRLGSYIEIEINDYDDHFYDAAFFSQITLSLVNMVYARKVYLKLNNAEKTAEEVFSLMNQYCKRHVAHSIAFVDEAQVPDSSR
ncbi:MAG: hypothetical protein IJS38_00030 [Erysipelotrichaceae bacterium]|nr:hypothetical protein [Erysipelotrichaceae bacterium]